LSKLAKFIQHIFLKSQLHLHYLVLDNPISLQCTSSGRISLPVGTVESCWQTAEGAQWKWPWFWVRTRTLTQTRARKPNGSSIWPTGRV